MSDVEAAAGRARDAAGLGLLLLLLLLLHWGRAGMQSRWYSQTGKMHVECDTNASSVNAAERRRWMLSVRMGAFGLDSMWLRLDNCGGAAKDSSCGVARVQRG